MTDREQLMTAWIALQESWWAHDDLYEKCESDPEFAWNVLIELIARSPNRDVLEVTAAGPLEELLRAHAPLLIDRVEALERVSSSFREALAIVRIPQSDDATVRRLLALGCASLPAQFAPIEHMPNETFLRWAADGGLAPDSRYPGSNALVFPAFPDCWSAWSPSNEPGQLPMFLETAFRAASANGPYFVRLRGGGAFYGDILSNSVREQVLSRVLGSLNLPRESVGALRIHDDRWASLILLATAFFCFGYRVQTDLEIIPENRRCCLMLDHHGSLLGHFAGDDVLQKFTEAMRQAGYTPEGEDELT
jgi:hypothetical protein